ncbi:hypothetical protein ASC61_05015 [Aeromicrobium sp. Root344]|uniref:class I SAM-dependent methyltransferase n=1 Tax=Aeromicrobium sp. Root344 TaxID=1736521 RepID=UPI0006FFC237|nr:class I SAM-dependent methyltransferase [Aeromicrobium sp. Root344]KQV74412.1 hypothetical protein ASC61_05015 [Aeromicrobium sp. Root344]
MSQRNSRNHAEAVVAAQEINYTDEFDYDNSSPHLTHDNLRTMVETRMVKLVEQTLARQGSCRVLEVGAGHGTFTRSVLDAGAQITVTETSTASADYLRRTFGDAIEVRFDETGEEILKTEERWDIAVMTSVLHHIPDYLAFLTGLTGLVAPGGSIFTVQDPLYYPRMSKVAHAADRATYFAWRLVQGNYGRGLATRLRRLRGTYDDAAPSDLVEYHVMRDGVDEVAIEKQLSESFESVEIFRYWSTQAKIWQRLGERTRMVTTFGVEATGRRR